MKGTIAGIKKPFEMQAKKDGGTFGPAMLIDCELENGEVATLFVWEERAIGEELELEKNGQYWNVAKEQKKTSVDLEPVLTALRELYKLNKSIERKLDQLMGVETAVEPVRTPEPPRNGYERAKEVAKHLERSLDRDDSEPLPEPPPYLDKVIDDFDEGEEIDLDSIPF